MGPTSTFVADFVTEDPMFSRWINVLETGLIILSSAALIWFLAEWPCKDHFMALSWGCMSVFYFYFGAFALTGRRTRHFFNGRIMNEIGLLGIISTLMGGAGLGLIYAGTGLTLLNGDISAEILVAGVILIAGAFIGTLRSFGNEPKRKRLILIRFCFSGGIGSALLLADILFG